jgi:hypothetical protein
VALAAGTVIQPLADHAHDLHITCVLRYAGPRLESRSDENAIKCAGYPSRIGARQRFAGKGRPTS